jgi:2-polyprenyl-6-methoxyphenol hydroxylase-like FAD-dependent oxidoreductase
MSLNVLVAGAGPAGLTLAAELARFGVSVRVIEKAPSRPVQSRALFLWSRTLELLDRAGCARAFLAEGHKVDTVNIVAENKVIGRVDFSAVHCPHPYALMLPQARTEAILGSHLNSLGVTVEHGVKLGFFLDRGDSVKAVLLHSAGKREEINANWLVGCDGAHSTVRADLGLTLKRHASGSDWALADVRLSGLAYPPSEVVSFWHEDGFLAIFPMGGGRYRVIADIGPAKAAQPDEPTLLQIQTLIDRRGPARVFASDPTWFSGFRVQEQNVARYRTGRIFVAGDAAHLHNPAGAQGMNMGMQDAFDLAWKLALACKGHCNEPVLLDSYDAERRPVADRVIANVSRLTAISLMTNQAARTARNLMGGFLLGLEPARQAAADQMTELSLIYKNSPMIGPSDGSFPVAVPGERMPPVAGEIPVGAGPKPLFALFAEPSAQTSRLIQDFPGLLEPVERKPPEKSCMWLVRPDGYVAVAGLDADYRSFRDYLDRIATPRRLAA